jgi:hypothetical protein
LLPETGFLCELAIERLLREEQVDRFVSLMGLLFLLSLFLLEPIAETVQARFTAR